MNLLSDFQLDGFCHSKLLESNFESWMIRLGSPTGLSLKIILLISGTSGKNTTNFGTECAFPELQNQDNKIFNKNVRKNTVDV